MKTKLTLITSSYMRETPYNSPSDLPSFPLPIFIFFLFKRNSVCDLEALTYILLHCHVCVRQIHVVDGKTMHHHHK